MSDDIHVCSGCGKPIDTTKEAYYESGRFSGEPRKIWHWRCYLEEYVPHQPKWQLRT